MMTSVVVQPFLSLLLLVCVLLCHSSHVAAQTTVTAVSPARGPMTGGNTVTITGTGFSVGSKTAMCKFDGLIYNFNGVTSTATVQSSTSLECVVPGILCEGATLVDVSMDGGKTYSDSQVQYYYAQYFSAEAGLLPYTTEEQGHIVVQVAKDVAALATNLHVVVLTPAGARLLDAPVVADGNRYRLAFELAHLPVQANMTLHATLYGTPSLRRGATMARSLENGDTLAMLRGRQDAYQLNRTLQLWRLPPNPVTVAVDRWRRSLSVGGAPFFAYGYFNTLYSESIEKSIGQLTEFAQQGFTHVATYGTQLYLSPINSAGLRAVLQYLDAAGFLGLKVHVDITYWTEAIARGDAPIFGGNWTSQLADIKTIVEYFKDHPGVLGWYISDDTNPYPMDRLAALYAYVKGLDPYHPITNTVAGSGQTWSYQVPAKAFDVVQYEMYDASDPGYQSTTIPIIYPMQNVPSFICGQGFDGNFVTLDTVQAQVFVTFMFEGTGYINWEFWSWAVPSYWKLLFYRMVEAGSQWMSLAASVLSSDQVTPPVSISSSGNNVWAKAYREGSGCMHIAVLNLNKHTDTFTLTSPVLSAAEGGEVLVLWENRTLALQGGNVTEGIGSYGTHMYRFNCSAAYSMVHEPMATPEGQAAAALAAGPGSALAALQRDRTAAARRMPDASLLRNVGDPIPANPDYITTRVPLLPNGGLRDSFGFDLNVAPLPANPPTFVSDSTTAVQGRDSLRLIATDTAISGFGYYIGGGELMNGTAYSVSLWVRVPALKADQVVGMSLCLNSVGRPNHVVLLPTKAFTNMDALKWTQLVWSGTAPARGPLVLNVAGTGMMWLDHVEVLPSQVE